MRVKTLFALATALLPAFVGILPAQESQPEVRQAWRLKNFRANWCIHFLLDSTTADKRMPGDFVPAKASTVPDLAPGVRARIVEEPGLADMIPSELCILRYDTTEVGDRVIAADRSDLDHSQFLVYWLIAATHEKVPGPVYFAKWIRTREFRLTRMAETALINLQDVEGVAGKAEISQEDLYQVKIGRTQITWEGHLAGDSSVAATPTTQQWVFVTARGARVPVAVDLQPEKSQLMVGYLRIVGKDELAKALNAADVRLFGPLEWGGGGSITFRR
ncbi:MAG: hypothetical protein AB7I33_11845 [Gemmatimonadales bacterium]